MGTGSAATGTGGAAGEPGRPGDPAGPDEGRRPAPGSGGGVPPGPDAGPDSPTALSGSRWWSVLRRTVKEFSEDNVTDWAAALTYYGVLSIFPVLGSGLIWAPGAIILAVQRDWPRAIGLLLFGLIVVGNVDNIIRPAVFRRWAQIHPLITLIGAFAGVRFFGILGLLIGPLALSYCYELLQMYSDEYLQENAETDA